MGPALIWYWQIGPINVGRMLGSTYLECSSINRFRLKNTESFVFVFLHYILHVVLIFKGNECLSNKVSDVENRRVISGELSAQFYLNFVQLFYLTSHFFIVRLAQTVLDWLLLLFMVGNLLVHKLLSLLLHFLEFV